jgi:hypothetical protein
VVNAQEFAAKYSSKAEVYRFLATEVGAYLPAYQVCTVFHVRDLAAGKRRLILAKEVKHINVPQFEGLSVEEMLKFAAAYPEVVRTLPAEEREVAKLHRAYVANVIYTLVGQPFQQWIDAIMEARNRRIQQDHKQEM